MHIQEIVLIVLSVFRPTTAYYIGTDEHREQVTGYQDSGRIRYVGELNQETYNETIQREEDGPFRLQTLIKNVFL